MDALNQTNEQDQSEKRPPSDEKANEDKDRKDSQEQGGESKKDSDEKRDSKREDQESESEDEQESLVAKIIKTLKPGAYARSALMSPGDKNEVESTVDIVMQEHEIHRTPMPTSKIHEQYEQLRGRIAYMLEVKKNVAKNEILAIKMKNVRDKLLAHTEGKKRKKFRRICRCRCISNDISYRG
jgi:hypothetical protein